MNALTFKFLPFSICLVIVGMLSCSKDDASDNGPAKTLLIQAVPDLPFADLYVSDTLRNTVSSSVGFGNFLPYVNVPSGKQEFSIAIDNQTTPLFSREFTTSGGKNYTIAYINTLSSIDAILFEDNLSTPDTTKGYLRFIHLSPNAPAVDFRIKNGASLFTNIAFKKASSFIPIDPGQTDYEILMSGVVIPISNLNVPAKKMYTIFLAGLNQASGSQALRFNIIVNK